MISGTMVYAAATAVYALTLVVCLRQLRRVPTAHRRVYQLATVVVAVGGVASAVAAADIGVVSINGYDTTIPSTVSDLVAYPSLWAITAILADVDRKTLLVVASVPFVQVLAFQLSAVTGGVMALAGSLVVIGGHVWLAVYLRNTVWAATSGLDDERRLLHWKARNLLLFLVGMLIVFAFLSLAGAFSDFGTTTLNVYVSLLIRVGFAGFLFANLGALRNADPGTEPSPDGVAAV
jgi:hypothetical protein